MCLAQENTEQPRKTVIYTFFVNIIPDGINIPTIGFINVSEGSHKSAQIGFISINRGNLRGAQMGYLNTAGGNLDGAQLGFINTSTSTTQGAQIGFINVTKDAMQGAQMGFVNTIAGSEASRAVQLGFINTTAGEESTSTQFGFVNKVANTNAQFGFVNHTRRLKGVQLGFINYVDSIESGFPLGLWSVVKKGGYRSVELSVSEIAAVELSYRIGIERIYSVWEIFYNPQFRYGLGLEFGIGSIIPLGSYFFFNPELTTAYSLERNSSQYVCLRPSFGWDVGRISIIAGPSLGYWHTRGDAGRNAPLFEAVLGKTSANNRFILGAKIGLRMRL
jgi:hypothetical protein